MSLGRTFLSISFVKSGSVSGDAELKGYEGMIELTDFDFSLKPKDDNRKLTPSGDATRIGVVLDGFITINKRLDSASTALMAQARDASRISKGSIIVAPGFAGEQSDVKGGVYVVEFEGGYIDSIKLTMSAQGKMMTMDEAITLKTESIRVASAPRAPDGTYAKKAIPANLIKFVADGR